MFPIKAFLYFVITTTLIKHLAYSHFMQDALTYSLEFVFNLGLRFRDSFPYSLSDVVAASPLDEGSVAIISPKDPLSSAVYVNLPYLDKLLDKHFLFRVTESAQSLTSLDSRNLSSNAIFRDLNKVYRGSNQKSVSARIKIPLKSYDPSLNPLGVPSDGFRYLNINLVKPTPQIDLAGELEGVLKSYGVIPILENEGVSCLINRIHENLFLKRKECKKSVTPTFADIFYLL